MAYAARPAGMPASVHSPPIAPPTHHSQHHQQQRHMQPPNGPPQPQHQAPAASPGYQGTLAPGTRVQVGAVIVTVKRYLSQGGFAHVYLVTSSQPIPMPGSPSGETLHVLKRMAVPDKDALAVVRGEVEVHKALRNHPNIVHFIEASASALPSGGYEVFILMEYCAGGGIIDLMNSRLRNRLTEKEVLKIFGDVCLGLAVMHHHDPPLMHRDLKIENILLSPAPRERASQGPTYKLCDFGSTKPILSRKAPRSMEEIKRLEEDLNRSTTLQYRAPEMVDVYQRRVIDEKADIWAMGVFLYKLCYYTTPFEENGGGPLAILNARYRFPPTPPYSSNLKELIASMLQEQSTSRPTIDEVILGVHRLLGTSPPASALHYTQLSSSGKQVTPLPSVVRTSAKQSAGSTGSQLSSSSGATYESGPDAAARALAIAQGRANVPTPTPPSPVKAAGRKSDGPDLIDMAPSAEDRRRAEAEEVKRRAEGITPMRRGRPTKTSAGAAGPGANVANASATRPLIAQLTGENATPTRAGPSASRSIPSPAPPPKSASASPTGFADSFEGGPSPSSAKSALSPGAAAAAATIASSASSRTFFNVGAQNPSLDVPPRSMGSTSPATDFASRSTPLRQSPALPGFSASNSPAPRENSSAVSPAPVSSTSAPRASRADNNLVDTDASRFPSVEELDARYAIPPTPSSNSSSSSSGIATSTAAAARRALAAAAAASKQQSSIGAAPQRSSTISIPGMSSRASLLSIAGRFGGTASGTVGRLNLTGTAAAASAAGSAETSTDSSLQGLGKPGERQRKGSVTSRWPHGSASAGINDSSNSYSAAAERPRPPSTTTKPAGFQLSLSSSTVGASAGSGPLSPNASGRPIPPLPARKAMPRDWLTGDHDEDAAGQGPKAQMHIVGNGTGASSNVASGATTVMPVSPVGSAPPGSAQINGPLRWEGQPLSAEPSKEAYRSPARYGASARVEEQEDEAVAGQEKEVAEDGTSGDSSEDEGPEDLDMPNNVPAGADRGRPTSLLVSKTPGKVKPPAWLALDKEKSDANGADGRAAAHKATTTPSWPPSRSRLHSGAAASSERPSTDRTSQAWTSGHAVSSSAVNGGGDVSPPQRHAPSTSSAVRAPAWDEDDEEMKNLPLPDVEKPYESRSPSSKPDGPLVDLDNDEDDEDEVEDEVKDRLGKVQLIDHEDEVQSKSVDAATSPISGKGDEMLSSPSPTGQSQPILLGGASWLDKHNARAFGAGAGDSASASPVASPVPASPAPIAVAGAVPTPVAAAAPLLPGAPMGVKERQRALLSAASSQASASAASAATGSSGPPPLHRPKPIALRSSVIGGPKKSAGTSSSTKMTAAGGGGGVNKANLKPWEREAAEKEEVEKYGAVGRAGAGVGEEVEDGVEEGERGSNGEAKTTMGGGGGGAEKEGFSGVSSLISQWQMNASKGAPGWGRIGELQAVQAGNNAHANANANANGQGNGREEVLAGRLPGRDVRG